MHKDFPPLELLLLFSVKREIKVHQKRELKVHHSVFSGFRGERPRGRSPKGLSPLNPESLQNLKA